MEQDLSFLTAIAANSGLICVNCGSQGHKKDQCTTKLHRIQAEKQPRDVKAELFTSVDNWLNGQEMHLQDDAFFLEAYFPLGDVLFKILFNDTEWRVLDAFEQVETNGIRNNIIRNVPVVLGTFQTRQRLDDSSCDLSSVDSPDSALRSQEVLFTLNYIFLNCMLNKCHLTSYNQVEVWGSWNFWTQGTVLHKELELENMLCCQRVMEAKKHYYKFKIDDQWCLDPWSPVENVDGNLNHVLDLSNNGPREPKATFDFAFCKKLDFEFIDGPTGSGQSIYGCSLNVIGENLYIFGGLFKENKTNKLFQVNIYSSKLREIVLPKNEHTPPPSAFHEAFDIG